MEEGDCSHARGQHGQHAFNGPYGRVAVEKGATLPCLHPQEYNSPSFKLVSLVIMIPHRRWEQMPTLTRLTRIYETSRACNAPSFWCYYRGVRITCTSWCCESLTAVPSLTPCGTPSLFVAVCAPQPIYKLFVRSASFRLGRSTYSSTKPFLLQTSDRLKRFTIVPPPPPRFLHAAPTPRSAAPSTRSYSALCPSPSGSSTWSVAVCPRCGRCCPCSARSSRCSRSPLLFPTSASSRPRRPSISSPSTTTLPRRRYNEEGVRKM